MQWKVTLSDVDFGDEEIDRVTAVLKSKWLTMGEVTQEFETRFAQYLGVMHAIAVTSGTAALHLAVCALQIREGDEVIVPSLTFAATANAVLYAGATPVFADIIGPDDLTISPEDVKRSITPRTRAVVVVHYGGYSCAMDAIMEIAQE